MISKEVGDPMRVYTKATLPSPKKVTSYKVAQSQSSKSIESASEVYKGNPGDGNNV
jgi:hypothetical protein